MERGFLPSNVDGGRVRDAQRKAVASDAAAFLDRLHDPEARGAPIRLPDGSEVPRLPGYTRWMWDGAFLGAINMRWQPGTPELPPTALGHVGYAVVAWRRREGLATRALGLLLEEIGPLGLPWITVTCDADNVGSIRVIEANGGVAMGSFVKPPAFGNAPGLRFRINLGRHDG
jgi:predicted acetyltransferase